MSTRSLSFLVALAVTFAFACQGFAGVVLSLDFGDGPVESGFTAFTSSDLPSQTFSGITVSETGAIGLFTRGAAGAYSDLYGDFIYTNLAFSFNIELDGLLPSTPYQLRLYSYDGGAGEGPVTTTFTPTIGTGASGAVTYDSNGGSPAVTNDQYSDLVTWTTDATGTVAFNVISSPVAIPRLDGLVLSVPEPASASLMLLGAMAVMSRRRRAA